MWSWLLWIVLLALAADGWQNALPDYSWSFPEDHWAHRGYRTEWWYLTGHLVSEEDPGRRFAYQFTFFRIGVTREVPALDSSWSASDLIMGHAAVTDPEGGRHVFSELLYREIPLLGEFRAYPDPLIAWARAPAGTADRWELRWNGKAFDVRMRDERQGIALDLTTTPLKPLVFQGPNGFSRKGADPGAASLYYSFTRLRTEGELVIRGERRRVRGESWMDKEIGSSQLGSEQAGWDWVSLQLDDGRDLMLYLMRRHDGSFDFGSGTLVATHGAPRYLQPEDWRLEATRTWTSPETGSVYPSRWSLEVFGENLRGELVPLLADQENRSRLPGGVHYWEGAVDVRGSAGDVIGRGFVELTGYGRDNRPPI